MVISKLFTGVDMVSSEVAESLRSVLKESIRKGHHSLFTSNDALLINNLGYSLSHVKIEDMDTNQSKGNAGNQVRPSYRRHKKQQFWQIIAPIAVGFLLMVAVMVLTILTAAGGDPGTQISGWADTSMIWLLLPVLMVAILVALLLFAMVYLLARALKVLPIYTGIVQQYAALIADRVRYFSNKLVSPIIGIRSSVSGVNKAVGKLLGRK